MTHQQIAAELEALNEAHRVRTKALDAEHGKALGVIREKCAELGHIYILAHRFAILSGPEQSSYACAVCGAWREKEQERSAA